MNVTMQAPAALNGASLTLPDGTQKTIGVNGSVTLDSKFIPEMLRIGFQVGTDEESAVTTGITAFAGGGQGSATALALGFNRIDTVATAGDSVLLPNSSPGTRVVVHNNTVRPCQVFGLAGDTINGIAAATGLRMPGNAIDVFYCAAAGAWVVESAFGFAGQLGSALWQDAITAFAGGGQGSAVLLAAEINRVTVVASANDSVKLPVANPGVDVIVINSGANQLAVFPSTGDAVNDLAANASVVQQTNSFVLYACTVAGKWYTEGIGSGYAGSFPTVIFANAITAFATGGQGSATLIAAIINRVSVCATAGDSVKLPVSAGGLAITITNDGAASCNVFPQTGDTINTLAANAAFPVAAGATVTFNCFVGGAWHSSPSQVVLPAKFTLNAGAGPLVASAGDLTGANNVCAQYSGVNGSTLTTRTAAQMITDGGYKVGQSYTLRIVNSAAGTLTLTAGDGNVTLTGHVAILTNTWVDYVVRITSATQMTFQSVGAGTQP